MSSYLVRIGDEYTLSSPLLPEIKVWVEIEGQPARVHGVEHNIDRSEINAAIQGKGGARFSLCYLDNRRCSDSPLIFDCYLEGVPVVSQLTRPNEAFFGGPQDYRGRRTRVSEYTIDESHVLPFQFGNVAHTDVQADAVANDGVLDSVATVALRLTRCRSVQPSSQPSNWQSHDLQAKIDENIVHEKHKKAQFAFAAGVGEKEERDLSSDVFYDVKGREGEPLVSYIFTVWSRAGLEIKKYIEEDVKPSIVPDPLENSATNKKRARSKSDSPPQKASSSKVAVAKKNKPDSGTGAIAKVKEEKADALLPAQDKGESVRRGKTLYIDFDEEEVEREEAKKA